MALVDYGSDSDESDNEHVQQPTVSAPPPLPSVRQPAPKPKAAPAPPPPAPSRPPQPAYSTTSGLALPPPKVASRKRIAPKFTLEPTSSIPADESSSSTTSSLEPPTKKAKPLPPPGSGSSALLSMLPAPKLALPKEKAMPKPVVLKPLEVGTDGRIESFAFERDGDETTEDEPVAMDFSRKAGPSNVEAKKEEMKIVKPLDWKLKSVVAEKKAPVVMDFFGMGSTPTPSAPAPSASAPSLTSAAPSTSSISITSAPVVPVFTPPEPTPEDPYPGYYLHPRTKEWAAYEPEYYNSFWTAWKEEEKRSTEGKEGKGWKGLDSGMGEVSEFKVADQGLGGGSAKGGASAAELDTPAPKAKGGSKHAARNQLSSLISNAQSNRSKLEEQIATAKRNKRAAGQAYGF